MPFFQRNGISLCYEQHGARADPTVLLIHGFTCQLIHWPAALIDALVRAGNRVVTFDHRDSGRSDRLDQSAVGSVEEILRDPGATEPVYRLEDLAGDALALLDHLGQSGAHLVGFSLGGMVAQQLALCRPDRVFSLTCIASSTSDRDLPGADRSVFDCFVSTPPAQRRAAVAHLRRGWKALGGPHYDSTRIGLGRLAEAAWERGWSSAGAARQLLALLHAAPRGRALGSLQLPSLVIHGAADPMVPLAAGQATADAIPGARLLCLEGMGHDLPDPLLDHIAEPIIALQRSAHAAR